jgi:hypothetical protein
MKRGLWLVVSVVVTMVTIALPVWAWIANGNVWPGTHPRVPFYISTNLQGHIPYDGTFEDAVTAILNATNEWNTHGGSELQFVYMGTTNLATTADDGVNVVHFKAGSSPHGAGNKAFCYYWETQDAFRGFDVELYEATGVQNIHVNYSIKATPLPWDTDVWSLVLHELGHALGLDHSQVAGTVMDTSCGNGCARRFLYADDIAGAQGVNGAYTNEGGHQEVVWVAGYRSSPPR